MWKDLEPVLYVRANLKTAAQAFQEIAHSAAISGGWTFSDQPGLLAAEKIFQCRYPCCRRDCGPVCPGQRAVALVSLIQRVIPADSGGASRDQNRFPRFPDGSGARPQ